MITDFRKALKLLDVIYTSDNDSIRESYNKIAVLASLDQTTGAFGPFESFYNDFQNIKWQIDEVRSKIYTLEQFQRNPATNYIYNTWLNNQIDARSTNNVTEHYLVKELQNKITVLENEIKKLTQEKDEQEPNSNTE
jgi:predicted  nucleic acid-binding Zn-ribbon protein